MHLKARPILIALVAVGILAAIFVSWDFAISRHFGAFPKIADTQKLREDCRSILAGFPASSSIPKEKWPDSITKLNPKSVSIHKHAIDIFISSGGIGPSFGILVFPDSSSDSALADYFSVQKYRDGIFFWQSQT